MRIIKKSESLFDIPKVVITKPIVLIEHGMELGNISPILEVNNFFREVLDLQIINPYDLDEVKIETEITDIIISYDSYYSPHNLIIKFIESNPQARIYYLINEYNIEPFSNLKKVMVERGVVVISNFDKFKRGFNYKKMININLNCVKFRNYEKVVKDRDLVYFGRFRQDRLKSFKRFFKKIDLSCSDRNVNKFKKNLQGYDIRFIDVFDWESPALRRYKYTIYIEDEFTHNVFNNLGTRFYEAISCNVMVFFDKMCYNTIRKSNYNIPDYLMVKDYDDLVDKMNKIGHREELLEAFRKQAVREKEELKNKIKEIIC